MTATRHDDDVATPAAQTPTIRIPPTDRRVHATTERAATGQDRGTRRAPRARRAGRLRLSPVAPGRAGGLHRRRRLLRHQRLLDHEPAPTRTRLLGQDRPHALLDPTRTTAPTRTRGRRRRVDRCRVGRRRRPAGRDRTPDPGCGDLQHELARHRRRHRLLRPEHPAAVLDLLVARRRGAVLSLLASGRARDRDPGVEPRTVQAGRAVARDRIGAGDGPARRWQRADPGVLRHRHPRLRAHARASRSPMRSPVPRHCS